MTWGIMFWDDEPHDSYNSQFYSLRGKVFKIYWSHTLEEKAMSGIKLFVHIQTASSYVIGCGQRRLRFLHMLMKAGTFSFAL